MQIPTDDRAAAMLALFPAAIVAGAGAAEPRMTALQCAVGRLVGVIDCFRFRMPGRASARAKT